MIRRSYSIIKVMKFTINQNHANYFDSFSCKYVNDVIHLKDILLKMKSSLFVPRYTKKYILLHIVIRCDCIVDLHIICCFLHKFHRNIISLIFVIIDIDYKTTLNFLFFRFFLMHLLLLFLNMDGLLLDFCPKLFHLTTHIFFNIYSPINC